MTRAAAAAGRRSAIVEMALLCCSAHTTAERVWRAAEQSGRRADTHAGRRCNARGSGNDAARICHGADAGAAGTARAARAPEALHAGARTTFRDGRQRRASATGFRAGAAGGAQSGGRGRAARAAEPVRCRLRAPQTARAATGTAPIRAARAPEAWRAAVGRPSARGPLRLGTACRRRIARRGAPHQSFHARAVARTLAVKRREPATPQPRRRHASTPRPRSATSAHAQRIPNALATHP